MAAAAGGAPPPPPPPPPPNLVQMEASWKRRTNVDLLDEKWWRKQVEKLSEAARRRFLVDPDITGRDTNLSARSNKETRTSMFALARDILRQIRSVPHNAVLQARSAIHDVTKDLTSSEYGQFVRLLDLKVKLEDHKFGKVVPPEFADPIDVRQAHDYLEAQASPQVLESLRRHKTLVNAMRDIYVDQGYFKRSAPSELREWYYPNSLLDAPNDIPNGTGAPRLREISGTKRRKGTQLDTDLKYIDTMSEALTEFFNKTDSNKYLKEIYQRYNLLDPKNHGRFADVQGRPIALKEGDALPPGYVVKDMTSMWDGFRATSVPERLFDQQLRDVDLDKLAKAFGQPDAQGLETYLRVMNGKANPTVADLYAMLDGTKAPKPGGPLVVIPKTLDDALQHSYNQAQERARISSIPLVKTTRMAKSAWLNLNPVRYNFNNFVGDMERLVTQFGEEAFDVDVWNSAIRSSWNYYKHGNIDALMQQALDYGIPSAGRTLSETTTSTSMPEFIKMQYGQNVPPARRAQFLSQELWSVLGKGSSAREDIMRLYVMEKNNRLMAAGQPPLKGVADPEYVKGLMRDGDTRRVAAYLARKTLGDYSDFTAFEDYLRNLYMPFYGWAQINTHFWSKGLADALKGDGSMLGRQSAAATAKGLALTLSVLGSMRVWNEMLGGDEGVPENARKGSHILLPDLKHHAETGEWRAARDADGRVKMVLLRDALDDFLTVLGVDKAVPEAIAVSRGLLPKDLYWERRVEQAVRGPLRYVGGQVGPLVQVPMAMAGRKLFPDPLNPTEIAPENKAAEIANALGAGMVGFGEFVSPQIGGIEQVFTSPFDLPRAMGYRKLAPASIMEANGISPYEAEYIRRLQRGEADIQALKGRMGREYGGASYTQLSPEQRKRRFEGRMKILMDAVNDDMRRNAENYQALTRTKAMQGRRGQP